MDNKGNRIKDLLEKGVKEGVFPGAVLLVAQNGQIIISQVVGHLSFVPETIPMRKDTIFDLASLTKPLATTLALMKLVDMDKIDLDQPLRKLLAETRLIDKEDLTPRLLLNHSAGLEDWKAFYLDLINHGLDERKKILREWLVKAPLLYRPGRESLYSDLGFMFLEWIIEERAGVTLPLFLERHFFAPLSLEKSFFSENARPDRFQKDQFAATEDCPWRKEVIQGFVHDENAYALGGYSGHAGLFGTVEEVYVITNFLRAHYLGVRDDYLKPETVRTFFTRQDLVSGSTWALGWDTPSPKDSSSGRYFSPNSVGHLGFTGTSIWMDLDQDVIAILLTNRIHPTRNNEKIKEFRPRIHDLIMEELGIRFPDNRTQS